MFVKFKLSNDDCHWYVNPLTPPVGVKIRVSTAGSNELHPTWFEAIEPGVSNVPGITTNSIVLLILVQPLAPIINLNKY